MPRSVAVVALRLALGALAGGIVSGCADLRGGADAGVPVATQWAEARALWYIDRDPAAYRAWTAIDPGTPEGREARRLLAEAEPLYLEGIREVQRGAADARGTFERAVRVAPMDPRLYLPLARAFRDLGERSEDNAHLFIRAAEYYRKFLALLPHDPRAEEASAELSRLDPDGSRLFAAPPSPPPEAAAPPAAPAAPTPAWPLAVALLALLLALAAVAVLIARTRRRSLSLEQLAERRPELHPAIAYLVGSLRHELLKHRIGAVGDAVDALGAGTATDAQRAFLASRLYEGEPIQAAWRGHLAAFERALGLEQDLARGDRRFGAAERAVDAIARLEPKLAAGGAAPRGLQGAHDELRRFDVYLRDLVGALTRTPVDGALFRDVVDEVRREYAAGQVTLEEVVIRAPEPAPEVEVFRVDLVLVLKNVVRNAILAVGEGAPPRRIGLDVETALEPTGEETVLIHVRDTSPAAFTTEDIYARRIDRGLGLVTAALRRYEGSIAVEPADEGGEWAKRVTVRFFRAD